MRFCVIYNFFGCTVTHKLFIPPYPADRRGSESLNVAMATGIVCSEFRRRAGMGSGK